MGLRQEQEQGVTWVDILVMLDRAPLRSARKIESAPGNKDRCTIHEKNVGFSLEVNTHSEYRICLTRQKAKTSVDSCPGCPDISWFPQIALRVTLERGATFPDYKISQPGSPVTRQSAGLDHRAQLTPSFTVHEGIFDYVSEQRTPQLMVVNLFRLRKLARQHAKSGYAVIKLLIAHLLHLTTSLFVPIPQTLLL